MLKHLTIFTICVTITKMLQEEFAMTNTNELLQQQYLENMEYFSLKLKSLYQAIDNFSISFQQQHIEEVAGCLDILGHSVNDIKAEMDTIIAELLATEKNYN